MKSKPHLIMKKSKIKIMQILIIHVVIDYW